MRVPIPLCRAAYRGAYLLLRVWWFVRRPHINGVKCVFTQGNRVLLVRHTYGHHEWDLPGGTVRRGEPPGTTATREMHEELGVTVAGWTHFGRLAGRMDFRRDTMDLFHAELGDRAITVDQCELAAAEWFAVTQLPADRGVLVSQILAHAPVGESCVQVLGPGAGM